MDWNAALSNGAGNAIGGVMNMPFDILKNYVGMRMTEASQQRQTKWYMDNYGSPSARMRMMVDAGINPFTAAQGIAGSGGAGGSGAPQGAQANLEGFSESGENVADTGRQMAEQDLLKTQEDMVKSQKKGQDIQNEINEDTKEDQKEEIRNRSAWQAYKTAFEKFYTENYPDMWNANLASAQKDADYKQSQINYYNEQINVLREEVNKLKQEIKTMKAQALYYVAGAGEQGARQALEEAETRKAEIEKQILEWEEKVNRLYGGDPMLATMTELNKVTPGEGTAYYSFMKTMKYELKQMETAGEISASNPEMYAWMENLFKESNFKATKLYESLNAYMTYATLYNDLCQAKASGVLPAGCDTMEDLDRKIYSTKLDMINARGERDKYSLALQEEYTETHSGTTSLYMLWSLVSRIVTLGVPATIAGKAVGSSSSSSGSTNKTQGVGDGTVKRYPKDDYNDFSHVDD